MVSSLHIQVSLLSVALTLCGCSRDRGRTEVTFLMWGDVNEIKSVRKSLDEFEELNPKISVRIIHSRGSDEYRRKFQTMFAGGIPPDIMYVEATDFPAYAERNIFLNLQPFVEEDKDFKLDSNVQALKFLRDLIYKYKVSPTPSMVQEERMFETGRVGMTFAGRWMCLRYKEIKDFKWDISELPRGKRKASVLFTVCYAISKECKNPDETWPVVKFMAGKEGQIETANSGHAIPSLISIAQSDYFLKAKELPAELNHLANINCVSYAHALPLHPDWLLAQDIIQRNIEKIFIDESQPIDEILKATQKDLTSLGHRE